ncbi:Predicted ATPase [Haloechinothrix alba]|uniref:Predicted ATPase n=1 Tax=Haloechinothrix alba TaxID=664784 RepID=A0A239APR3_9PSEU|nr:LuxR C-terminal-related transcriptional regulator [Haloechinothrix alba]SNR96988.1 Predicted ATPase [Haloechinothrix alba]
MSVPPKGNLPVELTTFVGRKDDLRRARTLLSSARLLTLTGPGGVGKTRLARQLAGDVHRAFAHGVWFVELADLRQGKLVVSSVANALGIRDESADPLVRLIDYLQDKQLLLVIDNCEHLADACAMLMGKLLAAAPQLRIVATSRHTLGLEGEQIFTVPSLTHESLSGEPTEAMELFAERATSSDPDFIITPDNQQVVAAICRRLEGVPLALELAAARIRFLTPDEILERLDDTSLLTSDQHTRPTRHRALEAAIEWSYRLCSRAEHQVWEQASVFSGGFTLEAMEAVICTDTEDSGTLAWAMSGLVDKSIVSRMHGTHGKRARYQMLEIVRQFAAVRLAASPDAYAVRRRHRAHFAKLAERGSTDYCSPREKAWVSEVRAEHANLRAALEFSVSEPGEAAAALEMASALRPYWEHYGFMLEGFRWLSTALEKATSVTRSRARALANAGQLALLMDEKDTARRFIAEYRYTADQIDVDEFEGLALLTRALLSFSDGEREAALALAEDSAACSFQLNDIGTATEALFAAAFIAFLTKDERADELAHRLLNTAEELGAQLFRAVALWMVGLNHWRRTNYDRATETIREGVIQFEHFGHPGPIALCIEGIAWTAASTGETERATKLVGAAKTIWKYSQMRLPEAMTAHIGVAVEEQLRRSLGQDAFAEQLATGKALSFDEAVSYALGDTMSAHAPHEQPPSATVLTRREHEIAALVAQGLTNKEIADKLVISRRTADSHVEHILRKLGFRTRTRIATWLSQMESPDTNSR